MVNDYENEFTRTGAIGSPGTSKQSIVGTAGAGIVGGRVLDAGAPIDWGAGQVIFPYLRCTSSLVGATGGVQVDIVAADDAGLVTNPAVVSSQVIPASALTAGSVHALPGIRAGAKRRRLGAKLTPLGTANTAGEVIVGITDMNGRPQNNVTVA